MRVPWRFRSSLRRRLVCAGLGFSGIALLGACSSTPDPTPVTVEIEAANNVNPDAQGEADPVVVRIYLLQKKDTFGSSEFNALYLHDKQVLAADIISSQEFDVLPGKTATFTSADAQTATAVGIVVAYRDIANATWRATIDLDPHEENAFVAHLKLGAVALEKKPDDGWFSWL